MLKALVMGMLTVIYLLILSYQSTCRLERAIIGMIKVIYFGYEYSRVLVS